MQITIKDIASKLGLSPTTVSRVLNGRESALVSETTRENVMQTALEMGYSPNRMARALVTGRTQNIALWVYGVHPSYYSLTIHYISQILHRNNYDVHVVEVGQKRSLMEICSWPVDGIIAFDCAQSVDEALQIKNLIRIPVVSLGAKKSKLTDYVSFDLETEAAATMEHLLKSGRKKIAFVSGSMDPDDIRGNCYIQAMNNACLPMINITTSELSNPSEQTEDAYRRVSEYLLNNDVPEAMYCYNDQTAIGVYRALYEAGLKIPDDVAVTGCDGIDIGEYLNPKLTTIVQPFKEMCELAWQFLQNRIENPEIERQCAVLKCRLEVRESTVAYSPETLLI